MIVAVFRNLVLLTLISIILSGCIASATNEAKTDIDTKVDALLVKMTLEEKAGQMTNIGLMALCKGDFYEGRDTIELDPEKMERLLKTHKIGSVQNMGKYPMTTTEWRRFINTIQDYSKNETRLGIPLLYGIDGAHGANYTAGSVLFPVQIGLAATWNPELAEATGKVTAYEVRASGISLNFGPSVDVSKQPLWGRISETFGEDTYLTQVMGDAVLRGSRGKDISGPYQTMMCPKHFIGYGTPLNGKDRSPTYLPERLVRQYYLPPFKSAIDQGVQAIMLNSGSLNGIPCHADKYLITDVLKGELGFEGFVITDWGDVGGLWDVHHVAKDEKEAVMLAVNAGVDLCMEPYDESFALHLIELVNEGLVPISRVDDAVRRILKAKMTAGLFEQTAFPEDQYPDFASEQSVDISLQAARESLTLLKNKNNTLPLPEGKKVLVTGVAANSMNYLNGAWSRTWSGQDPAYNDEEKLTIYEAIGTKINKGNLIFAEGTGYEEDKNTAKAVSLARQADYIVVCLGERPATEKPSDTKDLTLPDAQSQLVESLAKIGKPIILVLTEGRPRIIREIEPLADAILMAYYPGNEGGQAIADVLFGDFNPCGKLPYTYPKYTGSIWAYDHVNTDKRDTNWGFNGFEPQYEFGYGLSYTSFGYSNLKLNKQEIRTSDSLSLSVRVTNTGQRAGKEVVQLYLADKVATITPAVKQLKRFKKINLEPGNTITVEFNLSIDDLKFVDRDNNWVAEPGEFEVMIDTLGQTFILK